MIELALLAALTQPLPKVGVCPLGYYASGSYCVPDVGRLNQPLLPLLLGLMDAAETTARAINDNAWDGRHFLDKALVADIARQCQIIATTLEDAKAWK
jgi:hypothetical protein